MPNRLASSTSPYLLQHKDNPVDWHEWGPEAFAEARERDVPVLLSVGYAACHWCHVMAHESFEDAEVAEVVNSRFVAVKVDREERPDVDAVYMAATTALTGQGGWPMTCLLTPDGDPFFAGTYFPKPQFLQLLTQASTVWTEQRERVLSSGAQISARLREYTEQAVSPAPVGADELGGAVTVLRHSFDHAHGGFGGAPKFPPSMVLEFLLRHHARTGSGDALAMVEGTCEAMARGGMYDQLAGGFARYSVDAGWVVPHFEKMLYDNAQLLRVYAHWHRATGSELARRVATETAEFLMRDLATPEGGFASALDADTVVDGHSVEGFTYVWTPQQLVEVLGDEDGARAAELLSVTDGGTFEHGASTLQLRQDPQDAQWWRYQVDDFGGCNQPDVGRGTLPLEIVEQQHTFLRQQLPLDRIEVCIHAGRGETDCECRKPKPGMILRAAADLNIDLAQSWMVGDRWRDVDCGRAAGCRTIFINRGYCEELRQLPDYRSANLKDASTIILKNPRPK